MERVLIVGLGEVGGALYRVFSSSGRFEVYGYDVDPARTLSRLEEVPKEVHFLHIAIRFSNEFFDAVKYYVERFSPRYVVLHSTVPPGTTRRLHSLLSAPTFYSPVRGKHPNMVWHLYFWPKWVAGLPEEEVGAVVEHLRAAGFRVKVCKWGVEALELAKLWETVYRAIMIASWQELHRMARKLGVNIEAVAEFVGEVHEVLRDRPIYWPGHIGGHCLIPNTELLHSVYPSKLLEFVLESNAKRLEELREEAVREEVERVKSIAYKHSWSLYYE